jgi:excisionase family DNA binding protein
MNLLEETQLLTVAEVARRLQQTERTVRDKIASGQLPAVKIGTGPRAPIRVDRSSPLDSREGCERVNALVSHSPQRVKLLGGPVAR